MFLAIGPEPERNLLDAKVMPPPELLPLVVNRWTALKCPYLHYCRKVALMNLGWLIGDRSSAGETADVAMVAIGEIFSSCIDWASEGPDDPSARNSPS